MAPLRFILVHCSLLQAQGLLENMPHPYTYRAHITTVVIMLVKEKWDFLLDFYPGARDAINAEVPYLS